MKKTKIGLIIIVVVFETITANPVSIYLTNQNKLPNINQSETIDEALSVFVVGGFGLLAGKNETINSFITAESATIYNNFHRYIKKYGGRLTSDYNGKLILDIEHPVHPIKLHNIPKHLLKKYIKAINLRVTLVRNFFPYAQIGLYGLYVPYQKCGRSVADKIRLNSLQLGISNGILKNIDFITVVSYLRWMPSAKDINKCIAEKVSMINEVISDTAYIPLISLRIYNKSSTSNRRFVNYKKPHDKLFRSLVSQVRTFQKAGIKNIIVWHPNESIKPINDDKWNQSAAINALKKSIQKQN